MGGEGEGHSGCDRMVVVWGEGHSGCDRMVVVWGERGRGIVVVIVW